MPYGLCGLVRTLCAIRTVSCGADGGGLRGSGPRVAPFFATLDANAGARLTHLEDCIANANAVADAPAHVRISARQLPCEHSVHLDSAVSRMTVLRPQSRRVDPKTVTLPYEWSLAEYRGAMAAHKSRFHPAKHTREGGGVVAVSELGSTVNEFR